VGGGLFTEPPVVELDVVVVDVVVVVVVVELDVVEVEAVELVVELVVVVVDTGETSVRPLPCRVSVCGRVVVHGPVGPETVSV
jgi:hypothetical protein